MFLKIHSLSTGGAHSRVEASITSPTSAPYLAKQLTALFHTQRLFCFCLYRVVLTTSRDLRIVLKPSPVLEALGHGHLLGLAYDRKTWLYPMSTVLATVAFLLTAKTTWLKWPGVKVTAVSVFIEQNQKHNYQQSTPSQPPHNPSKFKQLAETLVCYPIYTSLYASICWLLSSSEPDNSQQVDAYQMCVLPL